MARISSSSRGVALIALALFGPGLASRDARAEDAPAAPRKFVFAGKCRTLDPVLIRGPEDERMVLACLEGLTALDPTVAEPKAAGAASWTTSPDGRTWTFTLRPATWMQRTGDGLQEKGAVKAGDFVYAWLRILDPAMRSPHLHILDGLVGVRALSTDKPRANALDRIVSDLKEAIGGEKVKKSMTGEDVQTFLLDPERNVRGWLGEVDAKEAREFITWPADRPYQGAKAWALVGVLSKARDAALAASGDSESHVGVDRGFYAKDDKTLVVEMVGPSPWLPSLLARGPLVAVNQKIVEMRRDQSFRRKQHQVGNGRFVSYTDFPPVETTGSGEPPPFKVELYKNTKHWDAAKTASDRITELVDNGADEVLRQYGTKECAWILTDALGLDVARAIRGAKAAGWTPKTSTEKMYKDAIDGVYDEISGRVFVLRMRCAAPLDKKEARQALAALVQREALAAKAPSVVPPPLLKRFVHPRTTGIVDLPRTPSFDAGKAAALYGKRKYKEGEWITFVSPPEFYDGVADPIGKAWRAAVGDDVNVQVKSGDDLRIAIDAGLWDALVEEWIPDYDDPLAFLSAFTTRNPTGDALWSNPLYDALIAAARDVASFKAKPEGVASAVPAVKSALEKGDLEGLRRALLAEAEALLLEEAVVVPLWMPVDSGIVRGGVTGLVTGPTGGRRSLLDVHLLGPVSAP